MGNDTLQKINSSEFIDKVLLCKADALVKVSTAWHGTGRMVCNPLIELAWIYKGKILFFQMDHDEEAALTATYRIETIPAILFFRKGMLVDKLTGLVKKINHR